MKTQNTNTKLAFKKGSILELNESHLSHINGGSSPTITAPIVVSLVFSVIVTVAGVKTQKG